MSENLEREREREREGKRERDGGVFGVGGWEGMMALVPLFRRWNICGCFLAEKT